MSNHSYSKYTINQSHNIGIVQGEHYGDNVFYSSIEADLALKDIALDRHNAAKARWEALRTCDWLMHESNFQSWEKGEEKLPLLWLHGSRGCGKSTLMSRIIERICHRIAEAKGHDSLHLLYFYVSYEDAQKGDKLYQNVLMTFWEQVTKRVNHPFGKFPIIRSIENELCELLISSQKDIYIIIDAWDQLPLNAQYGLIRWLNVLTEKLENNASGRRLSIAISSCDSKGIEKVRKHTPFIIEVTPDRNKHAIETYLDSALHSYLLDRDTELRNQSLVELSNKADGMFLWASLQASNICNMEMKCEVIKALENLPLQMKEMYQTYAKKFDSPEVERDELIARRTVALLAFSTGSMPEKALLVALSLQANGQIDQHLHKELTEDPTIIVRYCNYLVHLNKNLEVFQFCHGTAFEFFRTFEPAAYHYLVAKLCLYQLCSAEFSPGPRSDATWYNPGSLRLVIQKHPFLPLASSRWASSIKESIRQGATVNLQESHSEVLYLLKVLFNKDEVAERKDNLQLALQIHFLYHGKTMLGRVSHEHILSYFGLVGLFDIFKQMKSFDPEKPDGDGLRPIHWAIRNDVQDQNEVNDGSVVDTIGKLIEYGADVNAKDKDGRTPLYYAAYHGNLPVLNLLIRNKSGLDDLTRKDDETALIVASRKHNEQIVLALTKAGANVKVHSTFGTALQAISLIGCCNCARAIINRYKRSKISEKDGPFGTSLHAASFHGHLDLVKLLCSKRVKLHATHRTYGTALTAAAAGFNPELNPGPFLGVISELAKHGIDINNQKGLVGPALRVAAYHGSPDLVRLLLSKGAEVRKARGVMGTAYDAAKERGHQDVLDILVESDPRAAEYIGLKTPRPQEHQRFQRMLFKATVKASSIDSIDNLITHYEKFVEKEIEKGETPLLRGLIQLGVDCFYDVIEVATRSRRNPGNSTKSQDNSDRFRARDAISELLCPGFPIRIRTQASTHASGEDGFTEHFPQVLDRMTQAAVKILGYACARERNNTTKLIADRWIYALNNLISHPGFGEAMLETVVQKRAEELKGHLTNPDISPVERLEKAKSLALIGIELLLVAVEHKCIFDHLSFVLSKLWIKAVNDVDKIGKKGEAAIQELVGVFVEGFSKAVMNRDQANIKIYAQAGIEFMRAAALSSTKQLLSMLSKEWIIQWGLVLDRNMGYVAEELLKERWKEYEECLMGDKYDEGFGLAVVGVEVFGAAIKYKCGPATAILQSYIESGVRLILKNIGYGSVTAEQFAVRGMEVRDGDLKRMFDAFVDLFAVGEEVRPDYLRGLALTILGHVRFSSRNGRRYQPLLRIAVQQLEEARRIVDPPEKERQLIRISRVLFFALEVELCAEEPNTTLLSSIKGGIQEGLARRLNFTEKSELARYTKAVEYLLHN